MKQFMILYSFDGAVTDFYPVPTRLYKGIKVIADSTYDALVKFFRNDIMTTRIVESIREIK